MRMKKLLNKDVYTTNAQFFDSVDDVVIEIGKAGGAIIGLKMKKIKRGVVPFERVKAVGDIILVEPGE